MRLNFATLSEPMQKSGGQGGTPGTTSNHAALTRPHLPGNAGDTRGQATAPAIEGQAELIIGKQRHGATGNVTLRFDASITKFSDFVYNGQVPPER